MAVNREVAQAGVLPGIFLIDAHAHQMRHDVGEPVIVIALHPNHFDLALGIRKLANISQKLPVLFCEAGEVQVGEDVAQKNEPLKAIFPEHAGSFAGMTRFCTEMQVGKDQRVVAMQIHTSICNNPMLRGDEICIEIGAAFPLR